MSATRGPDFLRWQVHDATLRFMSAPPDMRMSRARKLVEAKFERGDYSEVLQALDEPTREALAEEMVTAHGRT